MTTIRPAQVRDVGAVLAFWTVATTVASSTDDVESVVALIEQAPGALIVAIDGEGAIAGTVIGGWDGWRGTMYRLAVAPSHRRQGVATRLVQEAEAFLVARGAKRLHLIVAEDEPDAEAFWHAVGYIPTGQTRFVKTLHSGGR
jgi:ribosomal protein S18 acetylase RimI-like enzyme